MDARYQTVAAALRDLPPEQPGRTLDLLARMLALTDQDVSDRTAGELKRPTVNQKRSGRSPVKASDLWPLAEAVGVDVDVLLLPPSQAAIWLAEHRASQLDAVGNGDRQHNGDEPDTDGRRRSLSQENGRLALLARQHNDWSYRIGMTAAAA